jgi:hypothetical protein
LFSERSNNTVYDLLLEVIRVGEASWNFETEEVGKEAEAAEDAIDHSESKSADNGTFLDQNDEGNLSYGDASAADDDDEIPGALKVYNWQYTVIHRLSLSIF